MTPDDLIARLTSAGLTDPDCLSMVRILAATEAAHVQQWSEIQRILTDAGIPMASVVQRVKALADSLAPGLPEGWTATDPANFGDGVSYPAHGPTGAYVLLHVYANGQTWWGQSGYATPAVYAYLLARAQGVGL